MGFSGRPSRLLVLVVTVALALTGCNGDEPAEDGAAPDEPGEETDAAEDEATEEEPAEAGDGEGIGVAVLFPGLVDDGSWNQIGMGGLERAQDELGVETAHSEQVSPAAAEEAFRDFAARGFELVIGHGGEFEDSALAVAEEFPDTTFVSVNGGADNGQNYAAYRAAAEQWKFVSGALAGLMTEADHIGYIGGMCFPGVATWVNGARDGAEHTNPDARFSITYTGDFEDSAVALESATAMIGDGADVIMTTLDEAYLGVIEAAQGTDVKLILEHYDHRDEASDNVLTSTVMPYGDLLYQAVEDVVNGTFEPTLYEATMADMDSPEAMTELSDLVPDDVREQVEDVQDQLVAGDLQVEADTSCP